MHPPKRNAFNRPRPGATVPYVTRRAIGAKTLTVLHGSKRTLMWVWTWRRGFIVFKDFLTNSNEDFIIYEYIASDYLIKQFGRSMLLRGRTA